MARARRRPNRRAEEVRHDDGNAPPTPAIVERAGDFTGRTLVLLPNNEKEAAKSVAALKSKCGIRSVMEASDFQSAAVDISAADGGEALFLNDIKVLVVNADPDQASAMSAMDASDLGVLAMEPERINYTCGLPPIGEQTAEFLRGYRTAVDQLVNQLLSDTSASAEAVEAAVAARFSDTAQATWGLQATRTVTSRFTGRNVRVAVLDTGFDFQHPDFRGRNVSQQSFVSGQSAQDGHGHGTHCIGTACGQRRGSPRGYGCASQANIYVGKVLSNQGSGADQGILAGINWAINNRCRIVSMSLGSRVQPGEGPSPIYENVAQRALAANCLIIAAAGNDSSRPGSIAPVGRPANSPSIMAVAALDSSLNVARFSNGGVNGNGGSVDIAGPGVDVFSSWPMPRRYHTISGTSMATPHVAGIAALWLEARPTLDANDLWQLLLSKARPLPLPRRDVGSGLVQAPQ